MGVPLAKDNKTANQK